MDARVDGLDWPPNVIVICSASFASSSCPIAASQNLNEALSCATNVSFGHVALTETELPCGLCKSLNPSLSS